MFLLIATSYWLGFGLLSLALASRGKRSALLLPLLALMPPAFVFVGIIWRDVLFATCWLLAASIAFAVVRTAIADQAAGASAGACAGCHGCPAAAECLARRADPRRLCRLADRDSRCAGPRILFVPAAIGLFAIVQLVYYGALGATRQHPLQSIMIFDLGGISHFAKENQYPVDWSEAENALLLNTCYQPTQWDIYWRLEPCDFVMRKIEREKGLFGTSAISEGLAACHPAPSARLSAASLGLHVEFSRRRQSDDVAGRCRTSDAEGLSRSRGLRRAGLGCTTRSSRRRFSRWASGCWSASSLCWLGWRRSGTREGAFVLGVCGSAAIYVLSFFAVGVASDFRYGYWAVLAGHRRRRRRRCPVTPARELSCQR